VRSATLRETAAALGCSPATVLRAERRALAKLAAAWGEGPEHVTPELLMRTIEAEATRRDRFTDFCSRLMRCRPGEAPADEPPGPMKHGA